MQLIVLMNQVVSCGGNGFYMAECPTKSTCKETQQLKEADLVFDESAMAEQVLEDVNKEDKEELDQALNPIDLVTPFILEMPIEGSDDTSYIVGYLEAYPTIQMPCINLVLVTVVDTYTREIDGWIILFDKFESKT